MPEKNNLRTTTFSVSFFFFFFFVKVVSLLISREQRSFWEITATVFLLVQSYCLAKLPQYRKQGEQVGGRRGWFLSFSLFSLGLCSRSALANKPFWHPEVHQRLLSWGTNPPSGQRASSVKSTWPLWELLQGDDSYNLLCASFQDSGVLPVGGKPPWDAEDDFGVRPPQWPAEVDSLPPDQGDREAGDVRPRHRPLLRGGDVHTDGEGHADSSEPPG